MGANRRSVDLKDVDLAQMYEPCMVVPNLILPRGGHFGVSASTCPHVIPGINTQLNKHTEATASMDTAPTHGTL